MMKEKIAMIFPYAPSYREAIYKCMDNEWDVDWYFAGNAKRPLKLLDYSVLRNCDLSLFEKNYPPFEVLNGWSNIDFRKYDYVIIPGSIRNISQWFILFKNKINHATKILFWTHGWYGKEKKWQKWLKLKFFSLADGIMTYGNHAKELMIQNGISENKIFVIYNSLDYTKHLIIRENLRPSTIFKDHFGNEDTTLIFIGRLTKVKKLDMLIDVIHSMNSMKLSANLVFVGDGEEKEVLMRKVVDLDIENKVWFFGACFDEKKNAELIYNADICVSPGNVGLTSIHALTFGTPVITNDSFETQMPEYEAITDGKTGAFFKNNDTSSLLETVCKWIREKSEDRNAIRQACFKEIQEKWNPGKQIEILHSIFNSYNE